MKTSWESVTVDNSPMGMYLAQPESAGPVPAIIVVQNQDGVAEFTQEMTGGSPPPATSASRRNFITGKANRRRRNKPPISKTFATTATS